MNGMLSRARLGLRGAEHTNRSWHVVDTWGLGSRELQRQALLRRVCCMLGPAFMEGLAGLGPSAFSEGVHKLRDRPEGAGLRSRVGNCKSPSAIRRYSPVSCL